MRVPYLLAAAILAAAPAAQAATYRLGQIEVAQPWSRPAAAGMTGAGYMTIANRGKAADTLTGVETASARKVEIHASSMAGGVMKMRRLDSGLAIPAGQAVALAPGGTHLMLIGLTKPLKSGDKVPATLVFASGNRLKIELSVGAAAPAAESHAHH